jgi:hypothetical protein
MNVRSFFPVPTIHSLARPQNLIRTLTDSQAKSVFPDVDLRLLLSTVKDGRVCREISDYMRTYSP